VRRRPSDDFIVDFHTMWIVPAWIRRHCVIPDRHVAGSPYVPAPWQDWYFLNFYRVRGDAPLPTRDLPAIGAPAFHYRRAQVVAPQKALAVDTPVPTPDGWSTIADLEPGDEVFTATGVPTRVVGKSGVFVEDTYSVVFDDGSELIAGGDHEWVVEQRMPTGRYRKERRTTVEMVGIGLIDQWSGRRWRVANTEPLLMPDTRLPIHPYALGIWYAASRPRRGGYSAGAMEVISALQMTPELLDALARKHGLTRRSIGIEYLRASARQRVMLLAGLVDGGGYVDTRHRRCEVTCASEEDADAIEELIASLGMRSTRHLIKRRARWRIRFTPIDGMTVSADQFTCEELGRVRKRRERNMHRRIASIERIDPEPTQCIEVEDASHTFLAGRQMIPTGNSGKGPMTAAHICVEGVGPALFAGWAVSGEEYRCEDHGCPCGWVYEYRAGEPKGAPWSTPLIQLTAYSEEQTGNVYDAFRPMVEKGPLCEIIPRTTEDFTRLPNGGRIDTVTSSNQSRLGQRVTFCPQDETGIWLVQNKMDKVAVTQRRGVSGMSGRSAETTNAWEPSENSVAQKTYEASLRVNDIFRYHPQADPSLRFEIKAERLEILKYVYDGSSWVDLQVINAEAEEIILEDPANAERFYGNRTVQGLGAWMTEKALDDTATPGRVVPADTPVAVGFDGSDSDDWTAIRCVTDDGFRFTPTYGPSNRPTYWNPAEWGGKIPRGEVAAAVDDIFSKYSVRRMYCDPRDWESEIGDFALKHGEEIVFSWATYRVIQMHQALVQSANDLVNKRSTHDNEPIYRLHMLAARKTAKPGQRYILGKPHQQRKIDVAMADALAHTAAFDVTAARLWDGPKKKGLTRAKGRTNSR
jgi:hypothetical protein